MYAKNSNSSYFLQYLYGAHDALIVKPFIFFKQRFLVKRRGRLKTFPSLFLHFFAFFPVLQQSLINLYFKNKKYKLN